MRYQFHPYRGEWDKQTNIRRKITHCYYTSTQRRCAPLRGEKSNVFDANISLLGLY
jgi:hypothetical protein